jgi:hypothetical protein
LIPSRASFSSTLRKKAAVVKIPRTAPARKVRVAVNTILLKVWILPKLTNVAEDKEISYWFPVTVEAIQRLHHLLGSRMEGAAEEHVTHLVDDGAVRKPGPITLRATDTRPMERNPEIALRDVKVRLGNQKRQKHCLTVGLTGGFNLCDPDELNWCGDREHYE